MPTILIVLFFWTVAEVSGSVSVEYATPAACEQARATLEAQGAQISPRIRVFSVCTPKG